jgi:hypothetical protein
MHPSLVHQLPSPRPTIMAAIDQVLARRGGGMSRSPSIDFGRNSCRGPAVTAAGVGAEADEYASWRW